jgi:thymidylate synthase
MSTILWAASWWEPGQANSLDVGDVSAIFMFFLAVLGSVVALSRWWLKTLRKMIREQVEEFTKPIQPNANGGKSLPDVSNRVDAIEKVLNELKEKSDENRDILLTLALRDIEDK